MNSKSEIKQAVLQDFGCDADDWLEGARKSASGFEGARRALLEASKHVQQIAEVVDKDIDNGEIAKLDGPLAIAAYAKLQVTRAVDSLANASKNYGNRQIATQGEIAAYEKVIKYLAGKRKAEIERLQKLEAAIASGAIQVEDDGGLTQSEGQSGGNGRPAGVRPSGGIAAQRRAEAAAEAKPTSSKVQLDDDPSAASPPPPEPSVPQPAAKKKATKKVVKRGGRAKGSKNRPVARTPAPDAANT